MDLFYYKLTCPDPMVFKLDELFEDDRFFTILFDTELLTNYYVLTNPLQSEVLKIFAKANECELQETTLEEIVKAHSPAFEEYNYRGQEDLSPWPEVNLDPR